MSEGVYKLDEKTFIGVDHASGPDWHTECEYRREADGSVTVLNIRRYPNPNNEKEPNDG